MGELVEFKANGGTDSGYLAIPRAGRGFQPGPGVIVIQEWWGLVDHIKEVCERFAGAGFVALAPDLYHGKTTTNANVGACVVFYGGHPNVKPDLPRLQSPVLSLSGDKDKSVTPDVVHTLEQQLKSMGKQVDVVIYPGADHAFFNDTRPTVYVPEAAADAWQRTIDFLKKHLS